MITAEIKVAGKRKGQNSFELLAKNISNKTFNVSLNYTKALKKKMKEKIRPNNFTEKLYDSIKRTTETRKNNMHEMRVYVDKSIAPHAIYNELGVKPHWVVVSPLADKEYTEKKKNKLKKEGKPYSHITAEDNYNPDVKAWAMEKLHLSQEELDKMKFLRIGGPNSRIRLRDSKNQFFYNSIKEISRANTRAQYIKAVRTAIKETYK